MGEIEARDASVVVGQDQQDVKEGIDVGTDGVVRDQGLHRTLKERHMQMIALGGVVG